MARATRRQRVDRGKAMIRLLLSLFLIGGLTACSLTPLLELPPSPVPASFPQPTEAASPAGPPGWRAMFGDPRLQRLIELALQRNRDLRLAALNVQATKEMANVQRAGLLPSVGLGATQTRGRGLTTDGGDRASRSPSRQAEVNVVVSAFELDLFGRVRALSDAALARYLASEHGRDAVHIALVGAVAEAYFTQQLAIEQRQLGERLLADWQQSLALARLLKQAEQSSSLDVAQAEAQAALAEAELEARRRAEAQAANALQLLVGGELPGDLPAALPLAGQPVIARLPAGLPSALLLHRPDLRQAEQMLVAANADIGAARAAFFPQISLTASFGYASSALGGLFDPGHQVWRFGPATVAAAVPGRPFARRTAPGRGPQVRGRRPVRTCHPERLPRGRRCPGRHRHLRPPDRRPTTGAGCRRASPGLVPATLPGRLRRAASNCSTRNASSTPRGRQCWRCATRKSPTGWRCIKPSAAAWAPTLGGATPLSQRLQRLTSRRRHRCPGLATPAGVVPL